MLPSLNKLLLSLLLLLLLLLLSLDARFLDGIHQLLVYLDESGQLVGSI